MSLVEKPQQKSLVTYALDLIQPFVIGGASGVIATCVIQPVDMVKVLIQVKSEKLASSAIETKTSIKPFDVVSELFKSNGIRGFYRGLDSAIARQVFYTTTRLGVYKTINSHFIEQNKKNQIKNLTFSQKAISAAFAGLIGSFVGNPADLALVRMQADTQLPVEQRRNYKNVFDAFGRIKKEQGFLALWRGATPTIVRAIVLNLTMLVSYDQSKQFLKELFREEENTKIRLMQRFQNFSSCAISGFLSSLSSLPFDNAKTRIQKMKADENGKMPYKNIFDAMGQTVKNQGFLKLWVGLPTFFARIAPHVMITLTMQDILTDYALRIRGKQ